MSSYKKGVPRADHRHTQRVLMIDRLRALEARSDWRHQLQTMVNVRRDLYDLMCAAVFMNQAEHEAALIALTADNGYYRRTSLEYFGAETAHIMGWWLCYIDIRNAHRLVAAATEVWKKKEKFDG